MTQLKPSRPPSDLVAAVKRHVVAGWSDEDIVSYTGLPALAVASVRRWGDLPDYGTLLLMLRTGSDPLVRFYASEELSRSGLSLVEQALALKLTKRRFYDLRREWRRQILGEFDDHTLPHDGSAQPLPASTRRPCFR